MKDSTDNIDVFDIEAQEKKQTAEQKRARQKEIEDIKEVLKTPEGRRFIWRIWAMARMFREPFNPNSNQTGWNLGRMSIGREVLNDVNEADWTAFAKIQQEYVSALLSKKQAKEAEDARTNSK